MNPTEITRGVLMRLQASIEETFRAIKSEYGKDPYEGQTDAIAHLCNRLAQLEGGLITLQQYSENLHTAVQSERLNVAIEAARIVHAEAAANAAQGDAPTEPISGDEELSSRSSQYRKSQKRPKIKAPDNEGNEDEQEDEEST
tara:strand:+ start:351 stop:779 length:429 start_codon:yes stop_codon:yes gene_type:complete